MKECIDDCSLELRSKTLNDRLSGRIADQTRFVLYHGKALAGVLQDNEMVRGADDGVVPAGVIALRGTILQFLSQ
jgi:hypothetical protein